MTKKVVSVVLCVLVIMFSGIAIGENSNVSVQDEIVIRLSAGINAVLVENNQFSKTTYILTKCDFVQDKPVVIIGYSDMSVSVVGNNYCSVWLFDGEETFVATAAIFDSDDAKSLFSVQYSE